MSNPDHRTEFDVLNLNTYTVIAYFIFICCAICFACIFSSLGWYLHKMYISSPTSPTQRIKDAFKFYQEKNKNRPDRARRLNCNIAANSTLPPNPASEFDTSTDVATSREDIMDDDEDLSPPLPPKKKLTPWPSASKAHHSVRSTTNTVTAPTDTQSPKCNINRIIISEIECNTHQHRYSGFSLRRSDIWNHLTPGITPALSSFSPGFSPGQPTPASDMVSETHMSVNMEVNVNQMEDDDDMDGTIVNIHQDETPQHEEDEYKNKKLSYENVISKQQRCFVYGDKD